MTPLPSISVVTIALNAAGTIRDCLQSVHSQSYPAEHVIVDGGSTDGTLAILGEYGKKIGRAVSEPDNGIYDAMNKGIAGAAGEVIGILNADDFYAHSGVLSAVAAAFADPRVDSCYGDLLYVDAAQSSRVIRSWRPGPYHRRRFYSGWMPPHPTFFVRKTIYEAFGGFNLEFGSAGDYELMLRFLVRHRITARYVPGILIKMRSGGISNASLRNRIAANRMDRLAWKANGLKPYPWTLWLKPLRKVGQFFKRC